MCELDKYCELSLITDIKSRQALIPRERTRTLKDWTKTSLQVASQFIDLMKPEVIIFQYVPNMYNQKGGINFSFPQFIGNISKEIKIIGIFHELYYPLLPELRSIILHPCHRYQLNLLIERCDSIVTTTDEFAYILSKIIKEKPIHSLPVYSNIKLSPTKPEKVTDSKIQIALIGGLHPSKKIPEIAKKLIQLSGTLDIKINLFGVNQEEWKEFHLDQVKVHGHLDENEFSIALRSMDLVIAYFIDGLSTRRGSVMSALQHGLPVISTKQLRLAKELQQAPGIYLLSRKLPQFLNEMVQVINNYSAPTIERRNQIMEFYERNYSVKRVLRNFKEYVLNSI